jgi:hypothetical protein
MIIYTPFERSRRFLTSFVVFDFDQTQNFRKKSKNRKHIKVRTLYKFPAEFLNSNNNIYFELFINNAFDTFGLLDIKYLFIVRTKSQKVTKELLFKYLFTFNFR